MAMYFDHYVGTLGYVPGFMAACLHILALEDENRALC